MANSFDLDALIDVAGIHARNVLLEAKLKELVPCWLIMLPNGTPEIVGTPWRNPKEKLAILKKMRRHFKEVSAVAYSLVTEVWTALAPKDPDLSNLDKVTPPSQRPDRQEAVLAIAADLKSAKGKLWKIVRDHKGNITELKDQGPAHPNIIGTLVGLFQRDN